MQESATSPTIQAARFTASHRCRRGPRRLLATVQLDSTGTQIGGTTYAHDAHGRQSAVTDARNGTTAYAFDDADRVTSVTTPVPGTGQAAQTAAMRPFRIRGLLVRVVRLFRGATVPGFRVTRSSWSRLPWFRLPVPSGPMRSSSTWFLCLVALTLPVLAASPDPYWPQFRGPDSLGTSTNAALPDHWSTNRNVAWKTAVPGNGWSSPITAANRVFLTTVVTDGEVPTPKKGLYFGGEQKEIPKAEHRWLLLGLDIASGRELWRREVHRGTPPNQVHIKNSYASETPVTDGQRVYAYFGNIGLFCHDLDGRPLWSKQWPPVKTRYGWGSAASPVLHGDRIFLVNDNDTESFAVCLDTQTGREIWRIARDEKSNWATPYIWTNAQRTELVVPGSKRVRSYDLDGKPLWEFGGMSTITIPTPFSGHGLLYVSSGYVGDKVRPVLALKPGATGDISLKPDETNNTHIAWYQSVAGPYNPSPILYGDHFYVLYDFGFLACHDARTGRLIYEKQRIRPTATSFTASPWAANGHVYALSEDGDTFVFQAGPEYRLLHQNSLGEMCLATPALAGDRLLIRTQTQLYCLRGTSP